MLKSILLQFVIIIYHTENILHKKNDTIKLMIDKTLTFFYYVCSLLL